MSKRTKKPPRTEVYVVVRVDGPENVEERLARALEETAAQVREEGIAGGEYAIEIAPAEFETTVEIDVVTSAMRAAWRLA